MGDSIESEVDGRMGKRVSISYSAAASIPLTRIIPADVAEIPGQHRGGTFPKRQLSLSLSAEERTHTTKDLPRSMTQLERKKEGKWNSRAGNRMLTFHPRTQPLLVSGPVSFFDDWPTFFPPSLF